MEDIVINGVSINGLKAQKAAIQQGAAKIISDSIDAGSAIVEKLLKAESKGEADTLAAEALHHFEVAEVVAGVSGVTFEIPYYEEYGRYDYNECLSSRIAQEDDDVEPNKFLDFSYGDGSKLQKLCSLLNNMESDSRGWNSSVC